MKAQVYTGVEYTLYGTFLIAVNMCILITISLVRNFQNALGTLLKLLTFTDILIGLVFLVDGIRVSNNWSPSLNACCVSSYALNLSFGIAIVMLGCISYDRYQAIVFPEMYPTDMTLNKARVLVGTACVGCGTLFLPSLLGWGVDDDSKATTSCITHWEDYSSVSFFFISLLIVASMLTSAVCYFRMLDTCIQQLKTSKKQDKIYAIKPSAWDMQTTKVFLGVISLFYLMWLPFMIMTFVHLATYIWIPQSLYGVFLKQGLFMGFLKYVIYVVWLPPFRNGLLGMFYLTGNNCTYCATELKESFEYTAKNWQLLSVQSTQLLTRHNQTRQGKY